MPAPPKESAQIFPPLMVMAPATLSSIPPMAAFLPSENEWITLFAVRLPMPSPALSAQMVSEASRGT